MMNCKKALDDAGGDMERAITILKEQGIAAVVSRSGKEAPAGCGGSNYIHAGARWACW